MYYYYSTTIINNNKFFTNPNSLELRYNHYQCFITVERIRYFIILYLYYELYVIELSYNN